MTKIEDNEDRSNRIHRIHSIVQEDYERISSTEDPFVVLNLTSSATSDQVMARYERYERFYRAENFQRLGDMDLTRKALDIRRAIGRAIVEIQATINDGPKETLPEVGAAVEVVEVGPDAAALGDIYFRDGLSYLKLGDFDAAVEHFQRASEYDPSRGIILANLAYTKFKRRPDDPAVVESSERSLFRAASIAPDDPEVFFVLARFAIRQERMDAARDAVSRIEALTPEHPGLDKLMRRINA